MYDAIIIGSGFSGICMAIELKQNDIHNFKILEKADEVGGTWRENTYPGAECDIPSALYSYSFEPYPFWEHKWSHQPQILEYLKYCAKKYDLYEHIDFNTEVNGATWNEKDQFWSISTSDAQYKSQFFITAIGQLHYPNQPIIEGHDKFLGDSWHSAQWNHDISIENKSIGVIGNAASAIQFIPQIAKSAQEIVVFQRSANWMIPKLDRAYKDWEKKLVLRFPVLLRLYRLRLWLLGGGLFQLMKSKSWGLRSVYERKSKKYIKKHIKDPELVEKLTPDYPMGAKRILISDDYYEALSKPHVTVETNKIKQFTEVGIQTLENNEYKFDIVIYATGFKTNPFLDNLDIVGKTSKSLKEEWKDGPTNYLGMVVNNFPNLFMMYGPNTNLGHNSIIIMSEAQASYIAECIGIAKDKNWNALEVKESALVNYYNSIQDRLKNMIWSQIDNSWYQAENGNIPNNWPGRTMEYTRRTKDVKFEDYNIT